MNSENLQETNLRKKAEKITVYYYVDIRLHII